MCLAPGLVLRCVPAAQSLPLPPCSQLRDEIKPHQRARPRDAGFSTLHVNLRRLLMADGRVLATRGGRCHPTERQDAASRPTPAGEQPVMSLCPLRIRREHPRRLCGRPLWAEPTEGFDRSIGWSGSAKALDDWRDQYHGHGRQILRTTRRSLGISSRDRSRVRNG